MKKLMFIFFTFCLLGSVAHSEENICHPEIVPASEDDLSYKMRGNRCEGLFIQKVSATGLRIAAFHKHPASYDDTSLAINISTNVSPTPKVLTVTSLKPKQYYRMDAAFGGANFSLPSSMIRHPEINVEPTDFAAIICKENCSSGTPTLVPASFDDDKPFNPYIAMVANLELFDLRIKIEDANTGELLFDTEMLGHRTWPAAKPATFPLKPYFDQSDSIVIEVVASGRGNKLIDSISARLEAE